MSYFQSEMAHFIIMIVLTCFMYYVPPTSWLMPMYTTCYAMVFATMSLQLENALMLRILYVAIAAIISWLATYYLLPNTAAMQFKQSVHTLFDIDVEMIKTIRKAYHQEFDKNLLRDLIIHSHLIANEIQVYMSNHMSEEEKQFYSQLLPINRQLVSEIEQLSHYLHKRKPYSHQKHDFMELIFMNFEDIIEEIRYSYTSNELTPVTAVHIAAVRHGKAQILNGALILINHSTHPLFCKCRFVRPVFPQDRCRRSPCLCPWPCTYRKWSEAPR